ncbi:MAG: hypothetical protein ACTSPV_06090 [Candidatus Hodarchaeales archaeon]
MSYYSFWVSYLPSLENTGFSIQLHDPKNFFTLLFNAFKKAKLVELYDSNKIKIASRTDRGVGAIMQIVSVDCAKEPIIGEINSFLPDAIRVIGCTQVSNDFNPRMDAISRTYSYFLSSKDINLSKTREILDLIKGTHDFCNFAKNDRKSKRNTIKTIYDTSIIPLGENMYQIKITGNSFLWQQIRRIIGHIIRINEKNIGVEHTIRLLKDKKHLSKPFPAPPYFLILEKVHYKSLSFDIDRKILLKLSESLEKRIMEILSEEMVFTHFKNYFEGLL